jgi:hypothetical protein
MSENGNGTPRDLKFWLTILFTICGTVTAGVTAWLGWMSVTLISMKSQVEMLSYQHRDVIPPVVETSLREIRLKTNEQFDQVNNSRTDIQIIQKELNYIKEHLKKP